MDNLIITICARAGSKGIPGKNRREINGRPLATYTVNIALRFARITGAHVALSTDSDEVKAIAAALGLHTNYIRPAELSADTTGKIDTIRDLIMFEEKSKGVKYDYVLDLDVTSPLRTIADLSDAFEAIKNDAEALNIFSVSKP
ncbi:MAG: acylneuraminate cytidylyltransferase family protein, partial [Bacteroidales bacterium]|nr:acylneuraminate cytidylyltransferase family protein [Bacteroidales bacterium]